LSTAHQSRAALRHNDSSPRARCVPRRQRRDFAPSESAGRKRVTGNELRLVIADDDPMLRQSIRQSLEAAPGIVVIGEAGDGETASRMIAAQQPQVAVLAISMRGLDGFGVAREVQSRRLNVAIVFLTAQSDESLLDAALDLGVRGYVSKESAASDIVAAVRAVAAGQYYVSSALTGRLIRGQQESDARQTGRLKDLTPAEMRVLRLVAEYKTTREIAEELFVSPLTIETHRRNICEKLGVRGSNGLVKFALAHQQALR
jgi:DNA-binding NarL/FixJ family response regulator